MTVLHVHYSANALELFAAAESAVAQIPPAFPLAATVAVNPYLGQVREERTVAATKLARLGGGRIFLPRGEVADMIADGRVIDADLVAAASVHGVSPQQLQEAAGAPASKIDTHPDVSDSGGRRRRHRLAGSDRRACRTLGGGAFRPRPSVLAGAPRRCLRILAGIRLPRS